MPCVTHGVLPNVFCRQSSVLCGKSLLLSARQRCGGGLLTWYVFIVAYFGAAKVFGNSSRGKRIFEARYLVVRTQQALG